MRQGIRRATQLAILFVFTFYLAVAAVFLSQFVIEQLEQRWAEQRSNAYIQAMYKKLVIVSGQTAPALTIDSRNIVNAYANEKEIVIFRGMIEFADNENSIALVLGHELAHYQLKHTMQANPDYLSQVDNVVWDLQKEHNSDKLGAFYALQAGYDVCDGRELWRKVKVTFGDAVEDLGHPYAVFRYANLHLPWCKGDL